MTLRDQMAKLMPGLRWTRPTQCVAVGKIGRREVARVIQYDDQDPPTVVQIYGGDLFRGWVKSPAHAAKTIRRKLREFRGLFDEALEENT